MIEMGIERNLAFALALAVALPLSSEPAQDAVRGQASHRSAFIELRQLRGGLGPGLRVQLYRTHPRSTPLFRPLTVYAGLNIDVSATGTFAAYSDAGSRIHLVDLRSGSDSVLGSGFLPQFSADGRYLAYDTPSGSVEVTSTMKPRPRLAGTADRGLGSVAWAHRRDSLVGTLSTSSGTDNGLFGLVTASRPATVTVVKS